MGEVFVTDIDEKRFLSRIMIWQSFLHRLVAIMSLKINLTIMLLTSTIYQGNWIFFVTCMMSSFKVVICSKFMLGRS